jgi:hypothetical protein
MSKAMIIRGGIGGGLVAKFRQRSRCKLALLPINEFGNRTSKELGTR